MRRSVQPFSSLVSGSTPPTSTRLLPNNQSFNEQSINEKSIRGLFFWSTLPTPSAGFCQLNYQHINQSMKQSINQPTKTNHICKFSSLDTWSRSSPINQPTNHSINVRASCAGPPLPPLVGSCQAINQSTINQGSLIRSTPPTWHPE